MKRRFVNADITESKSSRGMVTWVEMSSVMALRVANAGLMLNANRASARRSSIHLGTTIGRNKDIATKRLARPAHAP